MYNALIRCVFRFLQAHMAFSVTHFMASNSPTRTRSYKGQWAHLPRFSSVSPLQWSMNVSSSRKFRWCACGIFSFQSHNECTFIVQICSRHIVYEVYLAPFWIAIPSKEMRVKTIIVYNKPNEESFFWTEKIFFAWISSVLCANSACNDSSYISCKWFQNF